LFSKNGFSVAEDFELSFFSHGTPSAYSFYDMFSTSYLPKSHNSVTQYDMFHEWVP